MPRERPSPAQSCRLVLIDDQEVFRAAIEAILERVPLVDVVVVGSKQDPSVIRELSPEVVVCDPSFGGLLRLDYVAELREAMPEVRLVLLTDRGEREDVRTAIACGVQSFILKSEGLDAIRAAIEFVCMGGVAFSLPIASLMASEVMESHADPSLSGPARKGLSPREIQIIQLVARGRTDVDIGHQLSISPRTVQQHVSNALNKLGCHTRAEAVAQVVGAPLTLAIEDPSGADWSRYSAR